MLTSRHLVEKREHPLLLDAVQYVYCFPDCYSFRAQGCLGLSLITGVPPCRWEGAVFAGMDKQGFGGRLSHNPKLMPLRDHAWSRQFKSDRAANEWIAQAIELYGETA